MTKKRLPVPPSTTPDAQLNNTQPMTVAQAKHVFPDTQHYLSACTAGLPPLVTVNAMKYDMDQWARGDDLARYDTAVASARTSYSRIVDTPESWVAVGSQSSVLTALIADSVPDNAEVLCVRGDFSSIATPFLQQKHRGIRVRCVPFDELASSIRKETWIVAYSLVQSATGAIADDEKIRKAARRRGTYTLCDTTQAVGWLPVDATNYDATICHSYKWLCCPRGAAFLTISPTFATHVPPTQAAWYAGADPWSSCYGPEVHLADDAKKFDVSPAWPIWVGTATSLRVWESIDIDDVHRHTTTLGNELCEEMGLSTRDQAIITWNDPEGTDLRRMSDRGIVASGRAGRARVAFHVWNDHSDVDAVLRAIRG